MDFGDEWEGWNRALIGCPSVSGENVDDCLLPSFFDNVLGMMQMFMHTRELFYLADCQHFHTLKLQSCTHPNILFCHEFSLAQGFLAHLQSYSSIKRNQTKHPETSSYKQGNGTL